MPTLIDTNANNGKKYYTYDISDVGAENLALTLEDHADQHFDFQGRLRGETRTVPPKFIEKTLNRGGQVAAKASCGEVPILIRFISPTQITIIPKGGERYVSDIFMGVTDVDDYDEDNDTPPSPQDPMMTNSDHNRPYPDDYDKTSYNDFDDIDDMNNFAQNPRQRTSNIPDAYIQQQQQQNPTYNPYASSQSWRGNNAPYDDYSDQNDSFSSHQGSQNQTIVSKGEWLITIILMLIPIVNVIYAIISLVSNKTKESKKNYILIQLIVTLIMALLSSITLINFTKSTGIDLRQLTSISPAMTAPDSQNANRSNQSDNGSPNENANPGSQQQSPLVNEESNNEDPSNETVTKPTSTNANNNAPQPFGTVGSINVQVSVDNISFATDESSSKIVIATLTMINSGTDAISPEDALNITGYQGQNKLEENMTAQSGYNPDKLSQNVEPGSQSTFQVSYFLIDSQSFRITVLNKETNAQLVDMTSN